MGGFCFFSIKLGGYVMGDLEMLIVSNTESVVESLYPRLISMNFWQSEEESR